MITSNTVEATYLSERKLITDKVKAILVSSLNLDYEPDQINTNEILFGAGLGLDSIDSLQLTVAIKNELGTEIIEEDMWALRSVNTIVDYVMIDKGLLGSGTGNKLDSYDNNDKTLLGYDKIRNQVLVYRNQNYLLLRFDGEEELLKLNQLVTRDIDFTPEGSVTQTLILDDQGAFVCHCYFMNNFDHHYLLFPTEAKSFVLSEFSKREIHFTDLTKSCVLHSIEGYRAASVIESCFGPAVATLKPFSFSLENFDGENDYLAIRMDLHGEFGFLIISLCDTALQCVDAQFKSNHLECTRSDEALSDFAKQLLWLESCNFDPSIAFLKGESVIEAGLTALISFGKDEYLGKSSIHNLKHAKRLVYFRSEKKLTSDQKLFFNSTEVGYVVMCRYSSLLKQYVGNAYIFNEFAFSFIDLLSDDDEIEIKLVTAPQIIGHSYLGF